MIAFFLKLLALLARIFGRKPVGVPPAPGPTPPVPSAKDAWLAICITMVAGFEGLYTSAYKDPVGVTTICYGVTNADRPVKMGDKYTAQESKDMLAPSLEKYATPLDKCVKVPLPPHRKAALVSFAYNVGPERACKSSVVVRLNKGDVQGGCDALLMWTKAGGRELRGLVNRRNAERKKCLRND